MCNPNWTAWECILTVYLIQLLFIGIGLILGIISLISRDIASILVNQKPFLKIKDFEFNPQMPRKMRLGMQYVGVGLIFAGVIWIVTAELFSPLILRLNSTAQENNAPRVVSSLSGVSLVSMKYASGGWNPHQVDLLTATAVGIPAGTTFPLKFFEITVFAPPELAGFKVWAEFLANGKENIGETPVAILQPGLTSLESVKIVDDYRFLGESTGKYASDSWDVLKSWETIDVRLNYQGPAGQEGSTIWPIKLNQMGGTAWWNSPPDVNIVAVVYSVSDGFQQVLDLRREPNPVINAKAGDWITIHSVWYKANSNNKNNQSMFIGGSLNTGQQEIENKSSEMVVIREGTHRFENFNSMTWVVPSEIQQLGLIAIRSDDTVLDGYVIEISDIEKSGLVSAQKSIVWPFEQFAYLDFEEPSETSQWAFGWGDGSLATFVVSNKMAFSGNSSLAISVSSPNQQSFILYDQPLKARLIIGQVYWPQQTGINIKWARVCFIEKPNDICTSITPEKFDQWQVFVLDISRALGESVDEIKASKFYFNGEVVGASSSQPYIFYIDGIQIYQTDTD
jgi:hypothetical protein